VPSRIIKIKALFLALLFLFAAQAWSAVSAGGDRPLVVYLDPHYGGKDNGPVITKEAKGKDITLAIARAIQQELTQNTIKAYLSREDDVYIPRGDRWFFARKKGADIYLSIRLNLQDDDCIQIFHAAKQLGELKTESIRLASALSKSVKSAAPFCTVVRTKKDVIFETADFPAVIVEFGVARSDRRGAYVLDDEKTGKIARAIAAGAKEFIEGASR